MINLDNLTYRYHAGREALSSITTTIAPGVNLLLGENGAGKTTLLHLIAGLRMSEIPSECTIDGVSTALREPSMMSKVFLVSDEMRFPFPSINEMVERHAPFYPTFDEGMLRRNLEKFGMNGSEALDSFSLGNRKKAILAYAFALRTSVLLLDEPANGLDISAKQQTLAMMSECIGENQTVILSTHTVADFMQLFDTVILLSAGRLILNMPVWQIVECVDFVEAPFPPENTIYLEQSFGRFRAIVPHMPDSEVTDINYTLLYNALQNVGSRHQLLTLLTSNKLNDLS